MTEHAARPFGEILGHARAKGLLEGAVRTGRPSHAYLFVGPTQVGKTTLARSFARALTCLSSLEERPCGLCHSCRLHAAGSHPDFRQIDRSTGAEERRAARPAKNIPIEAVRALQHDAALSAHLGGYKVYLITEAEDLSLPAFDALLKTLEEPSPRVVIVMTVADTGLLPATIVSRCQVVRLGLVSAPEIASALIERGVEPKVAELLAHLAEGRPGWAFEAGEDPEALVRREGDLAEVLALDAGGRIERLKDAERFAQEHGKDPEATERRLRALMTWWRDVILVRSGCEELVVNWDRLPVLREHAGRLSLDQARSTLRAIEQTSQYLGENVQPRMALELLALSLPSPR